MMKGGSSDNKKTAMHNTVGLTDMVFSWSLEDIFNENLYRNQVGEIPQSFESVKHYLDSFVYPLLEDSRAEFCSKMEAISSAPFGQVISLHESKPSGKLYYDVRVEDWRDSSSRNGKEPYRTKPGDIIVFTEAKPETVNDLERLGRNWSFGQITKKSGDNFGSSGTGMSTHFTVKASKEIEVKDGLHKSFYVVFLMNITTNSRIWNALHLNRNVDVIKEVLCSNSMVPERCNLCPLGRNEMLEEKLSLASVLNKSQLEAVVECISERNCGHRSFLKLIWGPPGTGKTRTVSIMLWSLLRLKCRTLTCAPTNVAITEVASRVLKLVKESVETVDANGASVCCLGDILIYGNIDRSASEVQEIYLDYRVEKLVECLGTTRGWKNCFTAMLELLENCFSQYQVYCGNKHVHEKKDGYSFLQFVRYRFLSVATSLRNCISIICTHIPKTFILEHNFNDMVSLKVLLGSLETLLFQDILVAEELMELFSQQALVSIRVLRTLLCSLDGINLPRATNKDTIVHFCFDMASLIFCTASSSHKLQSIRKNPMKLLVIDEAAQLKECESVIPLQIFGIRHAILIGDECQLPAFVNSKISAAAGFGRSMFERLSILGHSRHLLNIQYRMHPKICSFPNSKFYQNRIMNAQNVKTDGYGKCYLTGPMFSTYSFIHISGGREVRDDSHSLKNMVEVAVVLKILQLLYRACDAAKMKVNIGVVSPYSAQISEIQRKLGQKYDNHGSFNVQVRSIDGCQGGEEDIIIISTVRSNQGGSIGFTSSPHRTNVALTRARHCLWILGNEKTLSNSDSVWEELILDAKVRRCFFNADENKDLEKVMVEVKKDLNQLEDLLNADSTLFRNARWKLMFSANFTKSFSKLESVETKNLVLLFLSKLAKGWRPKRGNVALTCESSSKILKQFKVGKHYILCSVDIAKESWYIQTLKVWDILPLQEISKLIKRLDNIFKMYTEDYIHRCSVRCFEGDLEVPMTWAASSDIVQYKSLCNTETVESSSTYDLDGTYLENSKVRDSLLLMKFYSLSSGAVGNLLSGCNGKVLGLPFELTDQEREIVHFNKSSFILGRSGTGKTTILTMKLFQNDQSYHIASEGYHESRRDTYTNDRWRNDINDSHGEAERDVLHQLFVTVSPKLCYAVKQHFSQLKRFVCGVNSSTQSSSIHIDDIGDVTQSIDIPDSFADLPPNSYPLIITFRKFLMMLDGTVGVSYFDRFPVVRQLYHEGTGNSGSISLETFIRTKEVTYDRFSSSYWPHFNIKLTRNLGSSTVFTEIMSVIKGGLHAADGDAVKLCQQDYVLLSEDCNSTLSMQRRETIYNIFIEYEKRKVVTSDFDLADLVIDLHRRLKDKRYEGDEMDFVFIDEVQDLSMRQIALFKYICKNVDEGFAFSGDTAQTIARGIDFRFEDIRCLFYKEFILGQEKDVAGKRNKKGKISRLFHLSHNFRTHAGVLKLAQSVINLIYHFFPLSIDFLNPETSLISGEAPILLDTGNDKYALRTIFRNTENSETHNIAFGAEQVILVRDDCLKKEICDYVGKKALVLTILECKGLEFQDVLLHNFFSSSPFQNQWRVIYEYMTENDLLGSTTSMSFTRFNRETHSILCSELKQLYVAVTRTKQRLWICENMEEFSGPMFDYWKKLCLVSVRQLDNAFLEEMQVASSQEEWKSRGIKLFYDKNYEMAMMCFERAGDTYWERLAEASGLQAAADRMGGPNSEMSHCYLRKAAEIFDEIGKAESAARLFFEINEYERAGFIYMNNFGESKLARAGECFCLAKCFKQAARVYAMARLYSECLSACLSGKLFDKGLQYIRDWKQIGDNNVVEMDRSVQEFLQKGALHYYELNYYRSMMEFVESFQSKDLMRIFLRNINCLDQLLGLEMKWGNFLEAAKIAKQKGDCLLEADLLEKAGIFQESSMLMLWYVFSNTMTSLRGKCRPSYQFKQKDEILAKAKLIAKKHSDIFYEFVLKEADNLSKGDTVGEILEMEWQFVQQWKQNAPVGLVKTSSELDKTEQDLLERCARHYYDLKKSKTMMKFVEAFQSIDLMRDVLKHLNCLDDLMLLEEEKGNFLEAADIAQQKGDLRRKSDLLEKSGHFEEASLLILWYVFAESLWTHGSKGWPLKQFAQKEELLRKAKKSAKNHSDLFYSFVCMEANILSNRDSSLSEMGQYLCTSQGHRSFRGEIIAVRRILDANFYTSFSMYEWNDELVNNLIKHPEVMICQNRVSVDTLVYLWKYWKDKILELVDYLCCDLGQNVGKYSTYEDFILNYFGVQKNYCNKEIVYVVLNSGANWVNEINSTLFWRRGDLLYIGAHNFVPVALSYFCSELLSVGREVLATLKLLHIYSCKNSVSVFRPGFCLVHMFEIAKFLENYKFPNCKYSGSRTAVQTYVKLSTEQFYDYVFHIDWKKSLTKDMISLRGRKVSLDLLKEAAVGNINEMNSLTSGQMGRVVMMILGSGKHTVYFNEEIMKSFDGHPLWKKLIEKINWTKRSDFNPDLGTTDIIAASNVASVVYSFCDVLEDNMSAHWRPELDHISPSCFLYLAERLLIMVSYFQGYFFTTKSSCVEWLIYEEWDVDSSIGSVSHMELPLVIGEVYNILVFQVQKLLVNKHDTLEWIKNSNNNPEDYYRLLVLRLMVLLCLICINSTNHFDKLFNLLDRSDLCADLPLEFCNALRRRECYFIDALADALKRIENPLVIVLKCQISEYEGEEIQQGFIYRIVSREA